MGGKTLTAEPRAEAHAHKVLAILRERNVSAGGCRMLKEVEQAFEESGGLLANCVEGIEYGVEKGWFNLSGVEIVLTEAGAKKMK